MTKQMFERMDLGDLRKKLMQDDAPLTDHFLAMPNTFNDRFAFHRDASLAIRAARDVAFGDRSRLRGPHHAVHTDGGIGGNKDFTVALEMRDTSR